MFVCLFISIIPTTAWVPPTFGRWLLLPRHTYEDTYTLSKVCMYRTDTYVPTNTWGKVSYLLNYGIYCMDKRQNDLLFCATNFLPLFGIALLLYGTYLTYDFPTGHTRYQTRTINKYRFYKMGSGVSYRYCWFYECTSIQCRRRKYRDIIVR